jgi:hypothetical protein
MVGIGAGIGAVYGFACRVGGFIRTKIGSRLLLASGKKQYDNKI